MLIEILGFAAGMGIMYCFERFGSVEMIVRSDARDNKSDTIRLQIPRYISEELSGVMDITNAEIVRNIKKGVIKIYILDVRKVPFDLRGHLYKTYNG
jgi:hypothetical protein